MYGAKVQPFLLLSFISPPQKKRSRGSQTLLSRFAYIIGILGLLCILGAARLNGLWPRSETNGSVTAQRD